MDTKEEKVCIQVDIVLVFDKHDYFGWRDRMKAYLKKYGCLGDCNKYCYPF